MKICFLTFNLNTKDGGGRFGFDLVSNLKDIGQKIQVLTNLDLLKNPIINIFKIRKIFKNSDIIHAVDIWPNGFYARLISFGLKKPIIITALGTYSVAPFYPHTKIFGVGVYSWRRFLMKWTCDEAQLIAISDYTKEKVLEIMPNADIKIIFPGFDLDFWSGNSDVSEEILRFKPYILSVGALKHRKGYHNSIRAFIIVAKKIENLNYVIIGQGKNSDYVRKLKEIIKENGLEKRVFFISSDVDDRRLLGFYRNAELFILTPVEEGRHFEGFGIVYLEAAASELPVVATYKSGATSAVSENYNGLLVSQNDPQKTADAIRKVLSDDALKTSLKNNSREWVKNFDRIKITAEYIKIYSFYVKHH
ncbi:MAG: glycosyltransferase family 4 protein [Patescibacteria group bacterium]